MFGAILKAINSSFQKGMTFCRSVYVKKVMKLLAFIFEQPSYTFIWSMNLVFETNISPQPLNGHLFIVVFVGIHVPAVASCTKDIRLFYPCWVFNCSRRDTEVWRSTFYAPMLQKQFFSVKVPAAISTVAIKLLSNIMRV